MFAPMIISKPKTPAGSQGFGVGTTAFTVPDGYLTLTITLAGAGGSSCQWQNNRAPGYGYAGGDSSVAAAGMTAYGGARNSDLGYYPSPPARAADGTGVGGTTNTTGGGGTAPAAHAWTDYGSGVDYSQSGGYGGYTTRTFLPGELVEGATLSVVVGQSTGATYVTAGTNGSATISWT